MAELTPEQIAELKRLASSAFGDERLMHLMFRLRHELIAAAELVPLLKAECEAAARLIDRHDIEHPGSCRLWTITPHTEANCDCGAASDELAYYTAAEARAAREEASK